MVGNKRINHLIYADAFRCFASSFDDLQDFVNACSKYAESHCIVFNASKSTGMIFCVPFSKNFLPKLYFAGYLIYFTYSMKYLDIV